MSDIERRGSPGSISGFTEILITEEGTAAEARPAAPLSIAGMMQRMAKLRQDLHPAQLQALLEKIDEHIFSDGEVHSLGAEDLAAATLTEITEILFPGTVPDSDPSISFLADIATLGYELTVVRSGQIWVTNESGVLTAVPTNELAIEHGFDGTAMIPLFPVRTNAFTRSGVAAALAHVGAGVTSRLRAAGTGELSTAIGGILGPDGSTDVLIARAGDDDNSHGAVMYSVGANSNGTIANVTSAFILPLEARYVTLRLVDTDEVADVTEHWVTIDTQIGAYVDRGTAISQVYIAKHPLNDWYRIGIEYCLALGSQTIGVEILGHHDAEIVAHEADEEDLFAIFGLNHTYGTGLVPFIQSTGAATVIGGTTLSLEGGSRVHATHGMILVEWYAFHNTTHSPGTLAGNHLLRIDDVDIMTLTFTGINIGVGAVKCSGSYDNDAVIAHALSYTPTRVVEKTYGQPREVANGTVSAMNGDRVITLGPAPGYLKTLLVYPVADARNAVNYLAGEAN